MSMAKVMYGAWSKSSVKAEDDRHLQRDLETLKQERASTTTRYIEISNAILP
jgi:hypothetical protein